MSHVISHSESIGFLGVRQGKACVSVQVGGQKEERRCSPAHTLVLHIYSPSIASELSFVLVLVYI